LRGGVPKFQSCVPSIVAVFSGNEMNNLLMGY
jgi:hypothetical protein